MENIIEALIGIENDAKAVMKEASKAAKALPKRVEDRKREIDKEIKKDIQEKTKMIEKQVSDEAMAAAARIRSDSKSKVLGIEQMYLNTHEALEQKIFKNIIGR
ncbi:hypothetical protein AGMMS49975_12670 [Clostridia bacterium]|nr:hypothetical protein AGMMS49975_12670 [Clostridia bacterium]GHU73877.1 hypothetical protein FACS1894188_00540 [Clostridia bacterium]